MHRVVRPMHDVYVVYIRRNSVHGYSELLVVKWLGFSVAVRVRVRAGDGEWIFLPFLKFSILKSDRHFCPALMAWGLI